MNEVVVGFYINTKMWSWRVARGITLNPDGINATSSEMLASTGANTIWAQPRLLSNPLHN